MGDFWRLNSTSLKWELINLSSLQGSSQFEAYPSARYGHLLVPYFDNLILYGGVQEKAGGSLEYRDDLWVFRLSSWKWQKIPAATLGSPEGKAFLGNAALENEGALYVFGGAF